VEGVIAWFRARGTELIATVMVVDEAVEFAMPSILARRLRELAGEDVSADDPIGAADTDWAETAEDPAVGVH